MASRDIAEGEELFLNYKLEAEGRGADQLPDYYVPVVALAAGGPKVAGEPETWDPRPARQQARPRAGRLSDEDCM